MADQPSNVHLQLAGTDRLMTADGFGKQHIFGQDRALYPVTATLVGPGTANGPVAPNGIRLVLVAFGIDWPAAFAANVAAHVDLIVGGNGPLGIADAAVFSRVTPVLRVPAGTAPGSVVVTGLYVPAIASSGGATMRFSVPALGAAETLNCWGLVYGVNAEDLACPT
jgi:hypothetical protein